MRKVWEIFKFAGRWTGPLLILLALYLFIFPFAPFMAGLSVAVAALGALATAIAFVLTGAPERRTSRKILGAFLFVAVVFAVWLHRELGRGYHEEIVSFDNRGAHLVATLYLPDRQGAVPGIVFIHGSGPMPRIVNAGLAIQLARWGYAVLLYDKRGTGDSSGHYEELESLRPDNIELLASDASAAHSFLAARPEVRADKVGFFGVSQAGWITPRAAMLNGHAAFMLLLSGPATSTHTQLRYERFHLHHEGPLTVAVVIKANRQGDIPDGMTSDQADVAAQHIKVDFPFADYDPMADLRALDIPGLWLLGDRDWMVPSGPTARNLQSLRDLGKPYEYRNIAGAGHGMSPGPAKLVEDIIEQWLARVTTQKPSFSEKKETKRNE